jgi:hypothetical protein
MYAPHPNAKLVRTIVGANPALTQDLTKLWSARAKHSRASGGKGDRRQYYSKRCFPPPWELLKSHSGSAVKSKTYTSHTFSVYISPNPAFLVKRICLKYHEKT